MLLTTFYLELKKSFLGKETKNGLITVCKLILMVKRARISDKQSFCTAGKTKKRALYTNDASEIQQPDSIILDSRKGATETQTVATLCWVWVVIADTLGTSFSGRNSQSP